MFDKWAQRLVATAILVAAIALLIGQGSYAYKEVATMAKAQFMPKR